MFSAKLIKILLKDGESKRLIRGIELFGNLIVLLQQFVVSSNALRRSESCSLLQSFCVKHNQRFPVGGNRPCEAHFADLNQRIRILGIRGSTKTDFGHVFSSEKPVCSPVRGAQFLPKAYNEHFITIGPYGWPVAS